jgi:hypothetical protein
VLYQASEPLTLARRSLAIRLCTASCGIFCTTRTRNPFPPLLSLSRRRHHPPSEQSNTSQENTPSSPIILTHTHAPLVRLTRASPRPRLRYSSPLFTLPLPPSLCLGPVPVLVPGLAIPAVRVPVHTHTHTHPQSSSVGFVCIHISGAPRVCHRVVQDQVHPIEPIQQAPTSIRLYQPALHYLAGLPAPAAT